MYRLSREPHVRIANNMTVVSLRVGNWLEIKYRVMLILW